MLNHVTITSIGTTVNSASYGLPTAASATRNITLNIAVQFLRTYADQELNFHGTRRVLMLMPGVARSRRPQRRPQQAATGRRRSRPTPTW